MHTAIYSKQDVYPTFLCIKMILGFLKRLALKKDDIIIIAVDSAKGSWRKKLDSNYKANREEIRKKSGLDWGKLYGEFSDLLENLKVSTPFHIVEIDNLEADDIIAYSCRYFKDNECIIISSDTDYEQLTALPNVKLLSTYSRKFKIIKNPYKSLTKKIQYEKTDNLISPILNKYELELRTKLVNLLSLPTDVETAIHFELTKICKKTYNTNYFRFPSLAEDIDKIYLPQKKTLSYSDSFKTKKVKVENQTLNL